MLDSRTMFDMMMSSPISRYHNMCYPYLLSNDLWGPTMGKTSISEKALKVWHQHHILALVKEHIIRVVEKDCQHRALTEDSSKVVA